MKRTDPRRLLFIAKGMRWVERHGTITDIKRLVTRGYFVNPTVNLQALRKKGGYLNHEVLIICYTTKTVTIHDPGYPAHANWTMGWKTFENAFTGTIKAWKIKK